MRRGRLEAFSDGVIAIIITIMVLELKVPQGTGWTALAPLVPIFVSYILSFVFIGIYWNNHHHLLQLCERVNGAVLWANLHLLFWLSLVPFVTGWMGENHFATVPTAAYGVVLICSGIAYFILARVLVKYHGTQSAVAAALGADVKGRISVVIYAVAIPLAFVNSWYALALYVGVALMWLCPDPRVERTLAGLGAGERPGAAGE
jgi:uncharacterized membrane protein